jgi:hypothetical protein
MVEKSITPPDRWRHHSVLGHPCVRRPRGASEGAILLLTRGRALAYATQHSPWTMVERACNSYATGAHGQGACGAMFDARGGGRAGMIVVTRHAEGPAGVGQRCPGVHAVHGSAEGMRRGL